jgi:hypothetical protein
MENAVTKRRWCGGSRTREIARGCSGPSGRQPIYKNRAGWAHDRLKRAGLSTAPRRGFWVLTDAGRAFDVQHRGALSAEQVEDLAAVARDSRLPVGFTGLQSSGCTAPRPGTNGTPRWRRVRQPACPHSRSVDDPVR